MNQLPVFAFLFFFSLKSRHLLFSLPRLMWSSSETCICMFSCIVLLPHEWVGVQAVLIKWTVSVWKPVHVNTVKLEKGKAFQTHVGFGFIDLFMYISETTAMKLNVPATKPLRDGYVFKGALVLVDRPGIVRIVRIFAAFYFRRRDACQRC